jgi:H+-translocating NAD(P) transhydrogenase subunit beta
VPESLVTIAYIAAGLLFIFSLGGLSAQESARRGNLFGIVGMLVAVAVTLLGPRVTTYGLLVGMLAIGGGIGAVLAARVEMTAMPQLVAILHSFVGAAAVLVGFASAFGPSPGLTVAETRIHEIEIFVGIFIGAVTFTGSVVAFGKLQGVIRSKPLLLPGRHALNIAIILASVYLATQFIGADGINGHPPVMPLIICTVLACILGIHLVMAIGGADMPVVVSMLNSYSGWAAAAAGFMLANDLLIITGALVGSSGAILSYIMCSAMNRSFLSIILGGFGAEEGAPPAR